MIGTIDVEVNAAHPNLPLCEFAAFVGSPSHVRVRNVPRGVGNWQITAVYLSVNYPDNSLPSVALTHVGALWTGTIPGSAVAGRSVNGYQITADGVDESGNAVIGYVLGVGDVRIISRDSTITVDGVTYYLHLLDAVPDTPHIGDVATIDGSLKLYDGNAWVPFAAGASIDVVAPSTDPADEGKAADAKATGDALAEKLSRAEAEAGFTEWVFSPATFEDKVCSAAYEGSKWYLYLDNSMTEQTDSSPEDATSLSFIDGAITATRTRLPTMADLAKKQNTISDLAAIRAGAAAGASAYQKPSGGIPASDMASAVQTSLGRADTAVQPSALAGYATTAQLRYDKIDLGIASPRVQTDYTDPDNPIDYVTLPLTDRAVAVFTIDTTIAELRLVFPDAVAGKIRDFGLFIYIQDTIPAPALVPPSGVRFFTNDGKMPTLASHDDTRAYTLMYFSEQPYGNIFLVKAEEVKEVS